MKAMPLPLGNGVLNFDSPPPPPPSQPPHLRRPGHLEPLPEKWITLQKKQDCYVGAAAEPTSVLDTRRSPSPPTSTSTLSSSIGGGGGGASTDTTVAAAPANPPPEKCATLGIDDWDGVLPESPGQGPSILGLIMGDVEDPSLGLNKLLHGGGGGGGGGGDSVSQPDLEFSGGFPAVDHGFVFEPPTTLAGESIVDPMFSGVFDEKPPAPAFSSQIAMNQHQFPQNPPLFLPLPYSSPVPDHQHHQHHHQFLSPPPAKRLNSGYPAKPQFHDAGGQEIFSRRHQNQTPQPPQQVQLFPHPQQRPASMAAVAAEQQGISEQLFKAVELIESGNSVLAQGILARLNQQLSPIGTPFQRAAFYFKDALQLLLQNPQNPNSNFSPFAIIFKISAYKSFSELSPVLQFANFTSNQALLESLHASDRIHIVDFDLGYGGQWASLMQELALRNGGGGGGAMFLKITAFASTSTHDEFELGFTQENLKNFAHDLGIGFELDVVNVESFNSGSWPLPLNVSENEAVAVNLPVGSFFNYSLSLPMVLRFVKHLCPKIVVSVDRGCNRMDAPFPLRVINALQSYSGLLESMDAVSVNLDTQLKIEKYLLQPGIEKLVTSRSSERLPPWRSLFLSSGFSPLTFSNFTESQAECLVHRTPVQGFHIEKRQSTLVLCWQRKELVSISAWRC